MRRRLVGFCWKARDKPGLRSFNTEFFNTNDASPRRDRSLRPPGPGIHACEWRAQQNPLLDHLVGAGEQRGRYFESERLGGLLRLITNSNLVGCSIGRSAGLAPFAIRST
jgi:hypothetical protein